MDEVVSKVHAYLRQLADDLAHDRIAVRAVGGARAGGGVPGESTPSHVASRPECGPRA